MRYTEIKYKGDYMELKILLKKLRESRGLTIKELAELAGVGNGTIGEIERGKNKSKPATLEKISRALKLTKEEREELFSCLVPVDIGRKIVREEINLDKVQNMELMEVPLFKSVSAGFGCDAIDDIYDFIPVPKMGGNIIAVEVQGDSMEDTIMDGAVIVVNKDIFPEVGEIGVFLTTGTEYPEGLVKRLGNKNGHFVLQSDNPKYDDITIESKNIVACGKVIRIMNDTYKRKKDPVLAAYNNLDENDQAIIKNMIEALSKKNK